MDPNDEILSGRTDVPYKVVWIVVGAEVLTAGLVIARQAPMKRGAVSL